MEHVTETAVDALAEAEAEIIAAAEALAASDGLKARDAYTIMPLFDDEAIPAGPLDW